MIRLPDTVRVQAEMLRMCKESFPMTLAPGLDPAALVLLEGCAGTHTDLAPLLFAARCSLQLSSLTTDTIAIASV